MAGIFINFRLSTHGVLLADMLPVKMAARLPYWDMLTFLFCLAMLMMAILMALNRRKFGMILRALPTPRIRSQLLRETKIFDDRIYPFTIIYNFLIQGIFIFMAAQLFIPDFTKKIQPVLLFLMAFGAVVLDYFIKMLNVYILTSVFENREDRNTFNLNKFFYQTMNSVALFPILVTSFYIGNPSVLWIYLPVFLSNYGMMTYRTLSLNSPGTNFLQFFLYFCTFEILPYLIIAKLLLTI